MRAINIDSNPRVLLDLCCVHMKCISSFWLLLLIFLVQASQRSSLSFAEAAAPPPSSSSHSQQNNSRSAGNSSVLSDFDGDGTSDWAINRFDGRSYSIEIHLSTRQVDTFLPSGRSDLGFCLLVRDVDLDNDQDLVLVSYTSFLPLVVWLNDGKANFKQGNRWSWLDLVTTANRSSVDPDRSSAAPVLTVQSYRLPFNRSAAGFLARELPCRNAAVQESQSLNLQFFPYYLPLRGPPPRV